MRSSYDKNILTKSNMYNKNINSSRNFFGSSSKLENLQNLYFYLNPYSKSTSINANKQLEQVKRFQSEEGENELDKKYGRPILNNYKRFHIKSEEIKKNKGKLPDKNKLYTNYTPEVKNNPNLAFYSVADLSMLHPLTYQKMKSTERYLTSGNLRNNTRLQMVDEKLKKLEEKNESLQRINDIFFDSLKDNLTQSLKRKAFLRKHLKDIEYLKQINLDEYNKKVSFIVNMVEEGQIDFDNYNFEGEPLNGIDNMAGRLEALKTEIGTMLTKNTMKNDINLNLLKQDVIDIKNELEKKLFEFSENNDRNYAILKEYLYNEEKDRLSEKRRRNQKLGIKTDIFTPEAGETFEIKGIQKQLIEESSKSKSKETEKESKENEEEIEESEVSTETNKNIDVIDKILLDSISLSLTSNGKNVKESPSSKNKKSSSKPKTYTVKKGDTLKKIAKKYLGSASKSKDLYKKNKKVIENAFKKWKKEQNKKKKGSVKAKNSQNGKYLVKGTKLVL